MFPMLSGELMVPSSFLSVPRIESTGAVRQNKAETAASITEGGPIEGAGTMSDEKFHFSRAPAGGLLVTQTGEGGNGRFVRLYSKVDGRWQMVALYTENPLN